MSTFTVNLDNLQYTGTSKDEKKTVHKGTIDLGNGAIAYVSVYRPVRADAPSKEQRQSEARTPSKPKAEPTTNPLDSIAQMLGALNARLDKLEGAPTSAEQAAPPAATGKGKRSGKPASV